jgi:methionyl-tRNA formyltransferase
LIQGSDEVVAVVTQPDREKGRGRKVIASPVKEVALQKGLSILQPEKVKEGSGEGSFVVISGTKGI